jgi:signal transduction histidine kinase
VSAAVIASLRAAPADDGSARFAAYIAHELRTPLASQRALLELGLADRDADTGTWRELACDVLDACKQQERLLEACLALSRSQAGLSDCEPVDIASLVAGLLRTGDLEGLIARVRLEPALTVGVPGLIERLLENLLANGVRHNRVGGWVALTTGSTETHALFTIENTGPRIRGDQLARLFEPFQQLSAQNAGPATGFGLGLAIAKSVADAHGARLTARGRPGGGLRVEVAFSLATDGPRKSDSEEP